jgi:Transglutaminase-like superfamily
MDATCRAVAGVGARLHATCLEQAAALVMLLAIARIPARLVIGVGRDAAALRAHAWVESGGRVVLGAAEAPDFVPFPSVYPSPCRG